MNRICKHMEEWKRAGQRWLGTQAATQGSGSGDGGNMAGVVAGAGHMGLAATPRRMVFGLKGLCAWLDAYLRNVSCVHINWAGKGQRREHVSSFQLRNDVPLNMWRQGEHKEVERNSRYMKEEGRITIGEWLGGRDACQILDWVATHAAEGYRTRNRWGMGDAESDRGNIEIWVRRSDVQEEERQELSMCMCWLKTGVCSNLVNGGWCTCCVVTHFIQ